MCKIVSLAMLVGVLFLVQVGHSAPTSIDGLLSDWGVTPFTDWVPNTGVQYVEDIGDGYNITEAHGFSAAYDQEALYFDYDATTLYFALVSSYEHTGNNPDSGDLALKIGGSPMVISTHGIVQTAVFNASGVETQEGLNYAVRMGSDPYKQVVRTDSWLDTNRNTGDASTSGLWWDDNGDGIIDGIEAGGNNTVDPGEAIEGYQGSPWKAKQFGENPSDYFTVLGDATIAISSGNWDPTDTRTVPSDTDTWIVEVAIPRSYFGDLLQEGTYIGAHYTMFCGNDSINLNAYLGEDENHDGEVPAPGAVVLASIGTALVGWMRRRRPS